MIFKDYQIILIINTILVIFLIFSISYIITINVYARISEKRKKLKFMEWDTCFMSIFDGKTGFSQPVTDHTLFAAWAIRYFITFKGEVVEKLKNICSQLKIQQAMAEYINSGDKGKRILGMSFFSASGLPAPEQTKDQLLNILETRHDIEFFYAVSLLSSTWPDDYALTVLTAMNREDILTMNIKLSVAKKMEHFIRKNYDKIFKQLSHDAESVFFMIEVAGFFKITEALPILKELYEKGNTEEQIRSMKAISDIGSLEFAQSFYQKFKEETEPVFQTVTFKSFLKIASSEHIDLIAEELRNKNWFVRYAAAKALTRMGSSGLSRLLECKDQDSCKLALAESGNTETKVVANDTN